MKSLRQRNSRKRPDPAGGRMGKQARHLKLVRGKATRRRCTLMDLVQRIQDTGRGDEEVVATIARLIESGEVVLSGTFADGVLNPPVDGDSGAATADNVGAPSGASSARFAR